MLSNRTRARSPDNLVVCAIDKKRSREAIQERGCRMTSFGGEEFGGVGSGCNGIVTILR